MEHEEFFESIGAFIDGELSIKDSFRVREHMKTCPECRKYFEELKSIDMKIEKVVKSESLPSDSYFKSLNSAIMAQLPNKTGFAWSGFFSFFARREMAAVWVMGLVLVFAVAFRFMFFNTYKDIQNRRAGFSDNNESAVTLTTSMTPAALDSTASSHSTEIALESVSEDQSFTATAGAGENRIEDITAEYGCAETGSVDREGSLSQPVLARGRIDDMTEETGGISRIGSESILSLSLQEDEKADTEGLHEKDPADSDYFTSRSAGMIPEQAPGFTEVCENSAEKTTQEKMVKIRFEIDGEGRIFAIDIPPEIDTSLGNFVFNSNYLRKTSLKDTFIEIYITPDKIKDCNFDF
ncbi:zf-HC2 domain-containing protein [candidate division WOR-3 bacterium]|nr:zf-HC2 domain-containing protein [candidate division WOR-3 bacterium]